MMRQGSSFKIGVDVLSHRVRRFSIAALVVSPFFIVFQIAIFLFDKPGINQGYYYHLGLAIAMLIFGASFILPLRLASDKNTLKMKLVSFTLFCLCLASALLWFPLNASLTK